VKPFTAISAFVLVLIAVAHVIRAIIGTEVIVGEISLPLWISWLAALIACILAAGLWKEGRSN